MQIGARKEYWTIERLQWLVGVMMTLAERDGKDWYFGPAGVEGRLFRQLRSETFTSPTHFAWPVKILVALKVIAPGGSGLKKADYRRAFYPGRIQRITESDLKTARRRVRYR